MSKYSGDLPTAVIRESVQFLLSRPEYQVFKDIQQQIVARIHTRLMTLDPAAEKFVTEYANLRGQLEAYSKLQYEIDSIMNPKVRDD